jgi:hypothetical protein
MRPSATGVQGTLNRSISETLDILQQLQRLYAALSYQCISPYATGV